MNDRTLYTIMLETSDDGTTWALADDKIGQAESCDPAALAAAVMDAEVEGMPEGHGWLRVGVWEPDLPGGIGLAEAVVVREPSGGGHDRA